jgi:hypothetical protein
MGLNSSFSQPAGRGGHIALAGRPAAHPTRPARRVLAPACGGLLGIASTVSLNRPRSPAMLADRTAISVTDRLSPSGVSWTA